MLVLSSKGFLPQEGILPLLDFGREFNTTEEKRRAAPLAESSSHPMVSADLEMHVAFRTRLHHQQVKRQLVSSPLVQFAVRVADPKAPVLFVTVLARLRRL